MISLGAITQGERGTLAFDWQFPVSSPATVLAATITAVMRQVGTDEATAVTGTLTGTGVAAVTWALSAGDSGTAGKYQVIFKAVVASVDTYTLAASLTIRENPAATAVQNPMLVGVAAEEATFLFDLYTAAAAANLGELAKSDGDGGIEFSAAGSGSDVADLTTIGIDAGEMFRVAVAGGLESRTPAEVLADIDGAASGHTHTGTYDPAGTAATAVSTHSDDTTDVHGIADTSALLDADDIGDSVAAEGHTHVANAYIVVPCSNETTPLTAGPAKATFRMPFAMNLTEVRASVNTAPTDSTLIVDINESGSSILSTKLSIDATEKTSVTADVPAVISDASLADDAEIIIDLDQVGSTVAGAGLDVTFIGTKI